MSPVSDDPKTRTHRTLEQPALDAKRAWGLVVVHSPDLARVGDSVALEQRCVVGRSAKGGRTTLVIDDPNMSRAHAEFVVERKGVATVRDLGSHNGIRVDRKEVAEAVLDRPAIVRLGETVLEYGQVALSAASEDTSFGRSPAALALAHELALAAASSLPLLLLGETGTGKEVAAQRLHALSGRKGPIVAVNCAALPAELIESQLFGHRRGAFTGATRDLVGSFVAADGGTLLLDEIGEMPVALQAKLLRALDTKQIVPVGTNVAVDVDVKLVAATNADLERLAAIGGFRLDLYARLAGRIIAVPPLRARRQDVPGLVRTFARQLGRTDLELTASFVEAALVYPWPMNIRELRTVVTRLCETEPGAWHGHHFRRAKGEREVAPTDDRPALGKDAPSRIELVAMLSKFDGNITRLAAHLRKDSRQIYRWLERYTIDLEQYRVQ